MEPSGGLDPDDGSHESDQDRRQQMFDMVGQAELKTLKFSITDFSNDFVLPPSNGDRPGSAEMNQGQHIPLSDIHQTRKACAPVGLPSSSGSRSMDDPTEREHPQKRRKGLTSSGPVVQQQKEAPVVTGTGRTHSAETSSTRNTIQTTLELKGAGITIQSSQMNEWPCLVCTLYVDLLEKSFSFGELVYVP